MPAQRRPGRDHPEVGIYDNSKKSCSGDVKSLAMDRSLAAEDATSLSARIVSLGRSLGEEPSPSVTAALVSFAGLFLNWNAKINLGGFRTAEELVDHHVSDAVAAVRFVGATDRVIDVGSGGGLPAIPMALLRPAATFDLFEPTGKKVAFLRTAVRELGLGGRVRVHPSRVQRPRSAKPSPGVGPEGPSEGPFDVACSRATFAPAEWVSLGLTLVREGGLVLAFVTASPPVGCPSPDETLAYGPTRRILAFRKTVSRGTLSGPLSD